MYIRPNTILARLRMSIYIAYMINPGGWVFNLFLKLQPSNLNQYKLYNPYNDLQAANNECCHKYGRDQTGNRLSREFFVHSTIMA